MQILLPYVRDIFLDYTVLDILLNLKVSLGKKKKKNQVYNIKDNSTAEIVACVLRTACMW